MKKTHPNKENNQQQKSVPQNPSRREFIETSAGMVAGAAVLGATVLGRAGEVFAIAAFRDGHSRLADLEAGSP